MPPTQPETETEQQGEPLNIAQVMVNLSNLELLRILLVGIAVLHKREEFDGDEPVEE